MKWGPVHENIVFVVFCVHLSLLPHTLTARRPGQQFVYSFSIGDPYVAVRTCQAPIGGHVAGFSRILTFRRVCFSMSVTSLLCFHNVHLARCPSGEKHLDAADCIAPRSAQNWPSAAAAAANYPASSRLAFQKGRFCYVTKPRAAWKTYCCSQSCS